MKIRQTELESLQERANVKTHERLIDQAEKSALSHAGKWSDREPDEVSVLDTLDLSVAVAVIVRVIKFPFWLVRSLIRRRHIRQQYNEKRNELKGRM